jgi:hypothetical protein
MGFPVEEIEAAFDRYRAAAAEAGRTGNWKPFVDCFTEDVRYVEHHYGRFDGRQALLDWIVPTMTAFPADHMVAFPWNWWVVDAERGWVVGEVANIMSDPGDGRTYQAVNWTRLVYGGGGLFREEEDVYNPAEFAAMIGEWLAARGAHGGGPPR